MTVTISLSFLLTAGVWYLHKYAGLKPWHGALCILLGFYLATSSIAPEIRSTITAVIRAVTGHG